MSARKLCSSLFKSSNSIVSRQFTSSTTTTQAARMLKSQLLMQPVYKQLVTLQRVDYSQALGGLTKDQAHDLVFRLTDEERIILMKTLDQYAVKLEKSGLETQLAASVWRSRFGRPSRIDSKLGEVVGGAFCKMPTDWMAQKLAAATPPPSSNDLLKLCLINSLPFVGFGFLDNFTMIIAGDYIEHSLGMIMTISTMAAAALGNTISDVLGIGSAVYVERFVEIIGVRPPVLTPIQLEMKSSRRASNFGRVLGITVGCLLGMLPLMFMKGKDKEEGKDEKKTDAQLTPTAEPNNGSIINQPI